MKASSRRPITTVLFDLGGVLSTDVCEAVLFDRRYGLAPHGWLARRRYRQAARVVWGQFSLAPHASETAFWNVFSAVVHLPINPHHASVARHHVLRANPQAAQVLTQLHAAGLHLGLVSDNTAFWYAAQRQALPELDIIDPRLIFLSFREGVLKQGGLYVRAAAHLDPTTTLVIEDRPAYRRAARRLGFQVASYRWQHGHSLAAALRPYGLIPNNSHPDRHSKAAISIHI